jgi:hypothetical protein
MQSDTPFPYWSSSDDQIIDYVMQNHVIYVFCNDRIGVDDSRRHHSNQSSWNINKDSIRYCLDNFDKFGIDEPHDTLEKDTDDVFDEV